jgi:hypothetical protein
MKCPYCNLGIKFEHEEEYVLQLKKEDSEDETGIEVLSGFCPEC